MLTTWRYSDLVVEPYKTKPLYFRMRLHRFKPSSKIFLLTVRRRYFFCGLFVLFMFCVCVLIHIWTEGEVGAPWNGFKPSSKIFFTDPSKALLFCGSFMLFLSCFLFCFCAHLFIDALWSPAGKGMTSWLSFVMSNCEVVPFPLVSWVRCGAWFYRFLIFALFLTSIINHVLALILNYNSEIVLKNKPDMYL